jgi:hypothetical protein
MIKSKLILMIKWRLIIVASKSREETKGERLIYNCGSDENLIDSNSKESDKPLGNIFNFMLPSMSLTRGMRHFSRK